MRSADVRLSAKGSSLTSQRSLDTIVPTQNSTKINTVMASSPPLSPQSASSRLEEKEGTVVKEHPAAEFNRRVKEMTNSLNYVSVASGSSSEGTSGMREMYVVSVFALGLCFFSCIFSHG